MPGEDIQSWSVTTINNGNADTSINWAEGQPRNSVNNSSRAMMAAHAKDRNLHNGSIVTSGTADAQAFTSGVGYIAPIPTGLRVTLKVGAGLTNTTSMTLNMDGIGATVVKDSAGGLLRGKEFNANDYVDLLYDGTNWIFLYAQQFLMDRLSEGGGIVIGIQKFVTAGAFTYTPTEGMECCLIECIGGGGAGGAGTAGLGEMMGGGGGGGGGYIRKLATATDIGTSAAGTVGAGGIGTVSNGPGGNGTSILSVAANGGAGGVAAIINVLPSGGAGGSGTGDLVINGNPGEKGFYSLVATTQAVYSIAGGGGASGIGGGGNGGNYGGGGVGGFSFNGGGTAVGGNGSAGAVIITEYAARGVPGRDGADGATGDAGPVGPPGPAGAGTGDVLVSGTPTAGQIARWSDTSHIQGYTAPWVDTSGTPTVGQYAKFTDANTVVGTAPATVATDIGALTAATADAAYLKLTGGSLTGDLGVSSGSVSITNIGLLYTGLGGAAYIGFTWGPPFIYGVVNATVSYPLANASDQRLKKDITASTADCLATLLQIPVMEFRWREGPTELIPAGFVAQTVGELAPYLAVPGNYTEPPYGPGNMLQAWNIDANNMMATLVGAVKQLAARIAELEAKG